jgi:hypothetical protein
MYWLPELYENPFPLNYHPFSLLQVHKILGGSLSTILFIMDILSYAASRRLIINV